MGKQIAEMLGDKEVLSGHALGGGREGRGLTWPRRGFTEKQGRRDLWAWKASVDEKEISQGWSQSEARSRGIREKNSWKHQDSRRQCRQVETEQWEQQRRIGKVYGISMRPTGHLLATLPSAHLPSWPLPSPWNPDVVLQAFQQNPLGSHHLSGGSCPEKKLPGDPKVHTGNLLTIKHPQNVMCYYYQSLMK